MEMLTKVIYKNARGKKQSGYVYTDDLVHQNDECLAVFLTKKEQEFDGYIFRNDIVKILKY